jgi:hypothetical protein
LAIRPRETEEGEIVVRRYTEVRPKWVLITKSLNGRSGNYVKNRWYKHIAKSGRASMPFVGTPEQEVLIVDQQKKMV